MFLQAIRKSLSQNITGLIVSSVFVVRVSLDFVYKALNKARKAIARVVHQPLWMFDHNPHLGSNWAERHWNFNLKELELDRRIITIMSWHRADVFSVVIEAFLWRNCPPLSVSFFFHPPQMFCSYTWTTHLNRGEKSSHGCLKKSG